MVTSEKRRSISALARRRLVLGKTQTEVAKDARMTTAAVSNYENGTRRPHPRRIRDLAFALGLQPAELVDLLAS